MLSCKLLTCTVHWELTSFKLSLTESARITTNGKVGALCGNWEFLEMTELLPSYRYRLSWGVWTENSVYLPQLMQGLCNRCAGGESAKDKLCSVCLSGNRATKHVQKHGRGWPPFPILNQALVFQRSRIYSPTHSSACASTYTCFQWTEGSQWHLKADAYSPGPYW